MEAENLTATDDSQLVLSSTELDSIAVDSNPFMGNWQTLISQTNWEKGQIILEWREKLQRAGFGQKLFSDPAWSRLVGEVTPQHVGRLRRTSERFGAVHGDYAGLYWSHFFAALDWADAEMWLEGAVQNNWSVSKMRYQRWETTGKLKADEPDPREIVASPGEEGVGTIASQGETVYKDDVQSIQGPLREGPDFGEESSAGNEGQPAAEKVDSSDRVDIQAVLEQLPEDISRPFQQLRAAIAHARKDEWKSVKRIHLVTLMNDLRQLLRNEPKPETPQ